MCKNYTICQKKNMSISLDYENSALNAERAFQLLETDPLAHVFTVIIMKFVQVKRIHSLERNILKKLWMSLKQKIVTFSKKNGRMRHIEKKLYEGLLNLATKILKRNRAYE